MPSGFLRWFRQSKYRALVDKGLWLAAWRSTKRAHKDKRARKHLLGFIAAVTLLLLLLAGAIVYLVFVIGTGAWLFVPFVIPVMWWIRRSAKREFAPMNIAPQPEAPAPPILNNDRLIRYLSKLALLHAVLVDRAGSESYIKQKELPEGSEVITRRHHLELLKSVGIWENLAPGDREAIMLPDGDWDWARINRVACGVQAIRALSWILRIDFGLPFIALQISTDFAMAHELVNNPHQILSATDLVDIGAIQTAREQTHVVLLRCLAESISRGYLVPKNSDMVEWAKNVSASLGGNQDEDLLIGDKLVSEATEEQLSWTLAVAKVCDEILTRVKTLMDGSQPVPEILESNFEEPTRDENQAAAGNGGDSMSL
jgi:hypothetical protein